MNENATFVLVVTICVAIVMGGLFATVSHRNYLDTQVKLACYEASKTNPNIKDCINIKNSN